MSKFLYLLPFLLCLLQATSFPVDEATTKQVWDHHIAAFGKRDLDAIVSDYSETAFIIVNNKVYEGHVQIRSVFVQLFDLFSHGVAQVQPAVVKAQTIYILWNLHPDGYGNFVGTDSFVVEDGKIQAHMIASELYVMFPLK